MSTPEQIKSYLNLKECDVQEVTTFAQTFFDDDRGVTMREAWCDKAKRSTQIFVQHNGESERDD